MSHLTKHITTTKHLLWVCFMVFAFSTCAVKDLFYDFVNLEYSKPLNKSKTTLNGSSCQYTKVNTAETLIVQQSEIAQEFDCNGVAEKPTFEIRSKQLSSADVLHFSGNSPPKYILYKRLKLDVV
jgi:hypothetical protein